MYNRAASTSLPSQLLPAPISEDLIKFSSIITGESRVGFPPHASRMSHSSNLRPQTTAHRENPTPPVCATIVVNIH